MTSPPQTPTGGSTTAKCKLGFTRAWPRPARRVPRGHGHDTRRRRRLRRSRRGHSLTLRPRAGVPILAAITAVCPEGRAAREVAEPTGVQWGRPTATGSGAVGPEVNRTAGVRLALHHPANRGQLGWRRHWITARLGRRRSAYNSGRRN